MNIRLQNLSIILLFLSAAVVPMYFTDFRFPVGGLILRLADLMTFTIIGLFVVCLHHGVVQLFLPKGFAYLMLFLLYCLINALWQSGLFKALLATFQWSLILMTIVIVYSQSVMYPEKFRDIFIKTLLIICFFVVLYHFAHGHFYRYKSLGDAKYIFGLTGVLILTYSFYFEDKKYLSVLFLLYPFLLLSLERKGILAFHLVLFVYICAASKLLFRWGVLFCLSILLVSLFTQPEIFDFSGFRFFEYSDYEMFNLDEEKALWVSNYHRQSLLENGWDVFTHNWVFGVGPKMLTYSMRDYYYSLHLALYTHNVFLDTLIEQGVVGLFLLSLPYFIHFSSSNFKSARQLICFLGLCIYSLIMLFFMAGGAPSMILMYLPLLLSYMFSNKKLVS
ncbi:O-antigen ligase family protein, partial [Psychromonas antarctica]|uniref:O-antigen ligase family protein n=1 Tax=Psychromonas antarctica TaxID=67573 RepID=UPI001EE921E3|nr:O-antigen ligase family protein [Psychromonas antarctica]